MQSVNRLGNLRLMVEQIVGDLSLWKLLTSDRDFLWSFNAQANVLSFHLENGNCDLTVDDDAFFGLS